MTTEQIKSWEKRMILEEKSRNTVDKYVRDVTGFFLWTAGKEVTKETVVGYKRYLMSHGYAVRSVNSVLASLNNFFSFMGRTDLRLKSLRLQKQIYVGEEIELTKEEYFRLLSASAKNERLNAVLKTICGTGIRVSELSFFTVEGIRSGRVTVNCKNKTRDIFIPARLRKLLLDYAAKRSVTEGMIFRTRGGKALTRTAIWSDMKRLCAEAGVAPEKVFPHNLRKLFARTFYNYEKDIAKLADVLGHSSIETTRIYIMSTGAEHKRNIERLGLI